MNKFGSKSWETFRNWKKIATKKLLCLLFFCKFGKRNAFCFGSVFFWYFGNKKSISCESPKYFVQFLKNLLTKSGLKILTKDFK